MDYKDIAKTSIPVGILFGVLLSFTKSILSNLTVFSPFSITSTTLFSGLVILGAGYFACHKLARQANKTPQLGALILAGALGSSLASFLNAFLAPTVSIFLNFGKFFAQTSFQASLINTILPGLIIEMTLSAIIGALLGAITGAAFAHLHSATKSKTSKQRDEFIDLIKIPLLIAIPSAILVFIYVRNGSLPICCWVLPALISPTLVGFLSVKRATKESAITVGLLAEALFVIIFLTSLFLLSVLLVAPAPTATIPEYRPSETKIDSEAFQSLGQFFRGIIELLAISCYLLCSVACGIFGAALSQSSTKKNSS